MHRYFLSLEHKVTQWVTQFMFIVAVLSPCHSSSMPSLKSLFYWTLLWTCLQLEVAALRCLHHTTIYQLIFTVVGSSGFSWANPLLSLNKDDMTFFFQVPLPGEVIEISCGLDHMAAIIRLTWISLPFCDLHVDGLSWDNSREKCKEVTNESLQLMLYWCQRLTW